MKFFIVGPDNNSDGVYTLLTEEGEGLASHLCSHAGFAKSDLESRRPERQKEWKEKFGDYEVFFVSEQSEITEEELLKRNKAFYADKQETV
ncbi:hypothetical protein KAR91_12620 [Candidatus Pacearchaeota archaeon]|nr:hypothetical protein [Candidatus Pacearchaeota archaeon]